MFIAINCFVKQNLNKLELFFNLLLKKTVQKKSLSYSQILIRNIMKANKPNYNCKAGELLLWWGHELPSTFVKMRQYSSTKTVIFSPSLPNNTHTHSALPTTHTHTLSFSRETCSIYTDNFEAVWKQMQECKKQSIHSIKKRLRHLGMDEIHQRAPNMHDVISRRPSGW